MTPVHPRFPALGAVYVYSSFHWLTVSLTSLTITLGWLTKVKGKQLHFNTYLKNVCFHGKYNSKPAGLWTAKIHPRKYEHAISHHAFKQLHFFVKCTRRDKLKESEDNATVTNNFDTRNQSAETCCFINQSALRSAFLFSRAYLAPVTRHVFPRLRLVARFGCDF